MNPSSRLASCALLLPILGAAAFAESSFPVRPPDTQICVDLAAPQIAPWGQAGPIRLIYHVGFDQSFNDLDRQTIQSEVQLIKDFYAHFGLAVLTEDQVWEVQSGTETGKYDFSQFKQELQFRGLWVPGGTIVFNAFDAGLGNSQMAYTTINDKNLYDYECGPQGDRRPEHGHSSWCGLPVDRHWGGILHEVGHLLGLQHDDLVMQNHFPDVHGPDYAFCGGSVGPYASKDDLGHALMYLAYRDFGVDPKAGLLPAEVDLLCRRHAPEACQANACGSPPVTAQTVFW